MLPFSAVRLFLILIPMVALFLPLPAGSSSPVGSIGRAHPD